MALAVRIRRSITLSSSLLHRLIPIPAAAPPPNPPIPNIKLSTTATSIRHFRSSPPSLYSARSSSRDQINSFGEDIGPDTILFEGCDYNHWLITMDFPKENPPTREQMIETYLQTLAKVVGSYKEAKKKMYAFSTTTYQGFQCLVSEEESEKFKGLPGVVFILPDSYIDPVNKEYGGDKYEDGVITPRPPPQQYGRQGGRYSRNTSYDNQGSGFRDNRNFGSQQNPPVPNQQFNQGSVNQGSRYGDNRNFGPRQNPSVPNQQFNQGYGNQVPRYGDNRNSYQPGNQAPDIQGLRYGDNRNSVPQQTPSVLNQQGSRGYDNQGPAFTDNRNSVQLQNPSVQPNFGPGGEESRNPGVRDSVPPYQGSNYNPSQQGYYNPEGVRSQPDQRSYGGDNRNYAPPQGATQGQGVGGNYRQVPGGYGQESGGSYGQMGGGNHGQVPGGNYRQGAGGNYSQGYQHQQTENRSNPQDEQRNYGNQGRY